jgi:hypothetical protein
MTTVYQNLSAYSENAFHIDSISGSLLIFDLVMTIFRYAVALLVILTYSCAHETQTSVDQQQRIDTFAAQPKDSVARSSDNDAVTNRLIPDPDCGILQQKITTIEKLMGDMSLLVNCGIDSFDLTYVVPNLVPRFVEQSVIQNRQSLTYADIVRHIREFKSTGEYVRLYRQVMTLDSLRALPFSPDDLERMKPVLGRLGFTETEWEDFKAYTKAFPLSKNKPLNWREVLDMFDQRSVQQ